MSGESAGLETELHRTSLPSNLLRQVAMSLLLCLCPPSFSVADSAVKSRAETATALTSDALNGQRLFLTGSQRQAIDDATRRQRQSAGGLNLEERTTADTPGEVLSTEDAATDTSTNGSADVAKPAQRSHQLRFGGVIAGPSGLQLIINGIPCVLDLTAHVIPGCGIAATLVDTLRFRHAERVLVVEQRNRSVQSLSVGEEIDLL